METELQPSVFDANLSTFSRAAVTLGLPVVVLVFFVFASSHMAYTPDDTYIYMRYAENLAEGNGFCFNPGQASYGFTGPLWLLLIAAGTTGGLDPYMVAKVTDLLFASLSLVLLYILALTVLKSKLLAFAASCLLALDAWFLRWTSSGLETSLAVLFAMLAVLYAYRNQYRAASFVSGVLTLLRPEASLLMGVLLVDNVLNSRDRRRSFREVGGMLGWYFVPIVPWLAVAAVAFGRIVPNTFAAKSGSGFSFAGLADTLWSVAAVLGTTEAASVIVLLAALAALSRIVPWQRMKSEIFPLLWVGALFLFFVVAEVQVVSRYVLPTIPFIIIGSLWGLKTLVEAGRLKIGLALAVVAGMLGVQLAQNQIVWWMVVRPHVEGFADGVENGLKPIGYWLRSNAPADAVVFAPDPGVIGYVSRKSVVDPAGLIAQQARPAFAGTSYDEGMEAGVYRTLGVDYVVDRSPAGGRLKGEHMRVIMQKRFPSLSIAGGESVVYTLYEVLP